MVGRAGRDCARSSFKESIHSGSRWRTGPSLGVRPRGQRAGVFSPRVRRGQPAGVAPAGGGSNSEKRFVVPAPPTVAAARGGARHRRGLRQRREPGLFFQPMPQVPCRASPSRGTGSEAAPSGPCPQWMPVAPAPGRWRWQKPRGRARARNASSDQGSGSARPQAPTQPPPRRARVVPRGRRVRLVVWHRGYVALSG